MSFKRTSITAQISDNELFVPKFSSPLYKPGNTVQLQGELDCMENAAPFQGGVFHTLQTHLMVMSSLRAAGGVPLR